MHFLANVSCRLQGSARRTVLGVIGRAGRNLGQFSGAHALTCPSEHELYVG